MAVDSSSKDNKNLQDIINSNNINSKTSNTTKKKKRKKKKNNSVNNKETNIKQVKEIKKDIIPIENNKKEENNIVEAKEIIKEIKEDLVELKNNIDDEIDETYKRKTEVKESLDNNIKEEEPEINIEDIKEDIIEEQKEIREVNETKTKKSMLISILLLTIIALIIYFLIPKISLQGDKNITISYNDIYKEPGYKASFLFKNITKNIIIDNKVKNGNIGTYKITYTYKLGFIKFKKVRTVNIIDNKKPEILLDDEVTICPNDDISKIKYEVFDEYDGDITNKAISKYIDNKLIITAKDSSNNSIEKEVIVKKEDTEKPTITLKGNETVYLNYGSVYNEPGYEAIDNCDGNITDKVEKNGTVGSSIGTYKITYSVIDSSNNKVEVTRTVIVRNNYLYNSGSISNGTIYLTFDDGPNNGTTNVILDVLKEEGVKATFFVTCNGPDNLIKRMYDEGHTVALHTATHNYSYVYSSVDNYFEDLNRVSNRVKNITGVESKIIRFPGGSSNTISRNYSQGIMTTLTGMVLEKGYRYFDWNVDSNDAGGARSSTEVYNNVTRNLSKYRSNVVLMHDIKVTTRDAIRNIIKYGKANGYNFEKIDMNTYMIRHGVNN